MKKEFLVNPDFETFIKLLNKHRVEYCITGAYAVSFHAEPRYTHDIDIYIAKQMDNSKKVAAAILEFFGSSIDEAIFEGNKVIVRMGIEPNQIELSNYLTGLTDDEIITHRIAGKYGDVDTHYIGIKELTKNKGVVKDMSHRGRKGLQDKKDYLTLLDITAIKGKRGKRK